MYKKIKKVVPFAVLSTAILLSPAATTFAAEKTQPENLNVQMKNMDGDGIGIGGGQHGGGNVTGTPGDGHILKGFLFKNDGSGHKTPVYSDAVSDESPYPELSANPNDPIPDHGTIETESGKPGTKLYFSKFEVPIPGYGNDGIPVKNVYLQKNDDGSITVGTYDPSTLATIEGSDVNTYRASDTAPVAKRVFAYMNGNTVKRETAYNKLGSGVVPKGASYTFSQAVTSGVTTSEIVGGALTLGYKVSVGASTGAVPGPSVTQEFSAQLQVSYSHNYTVSSSTTNTQTMSNPHAPASYPHDKYAGAVYQLGSKYTFVPGAALSQDIKDGHVVLGQNVFDYDQSTLYLAVTPGAGAE